MLGDLTVVAAFVHDALSALEMAQTKLVKAERRFLDSEDEFQLGKPSADSWLGKGEFQSSLDAKRRREQAGEGWAAG